MQLVPEAITSFLAFALTVLMPYCLLPLINNVLPLSKLCLYSLVLITSYVITNITFLIFAKKHLLQVVIRASFLGSVFFCGVSISLYRPTQWSVFGWYACILSFFHWSEYFCIAISNPKTLTLDAFMLNHSLAYGIAAVASWCEFGVEQYFFPSLKKHFFISIIGVSLCIGGELLRKLAMVTASTNFNHIVQTVKNQDHVLITHGVYSICRHPSYVGWFYWSVGTQLVLVNPVCVLVYTMASWTFFRTRLMVEEEALLEFFGDEYVKYKRQVHSGLPFNDGVKLER